MITAELNHVKTVEEFYSEIRRQQEKGHGPDYCAQHDAIRKYLPECESYKELGTHQGGTAACVMTAEHKIKYIELIDINHYKYRWKLQELAEPYCKENNIELVVRDADSSSLASLGSPVDMMLIDSVHRPDHLIKELQMHAPNVKKYMIFHDTFSVPQLQSVIEGFCLENPRWKVIERGTTNVGYTVIKRT